MLVIVLGMSLEAANAVLRVKRSPTVYVEDWNTAAPIADASIYLDGALAGTTDSSGQRVMRGISDGSHQLRVSKDGYTDYETVVNTKGGSGFTARVRITSLASPGSNVTYTVFIDTADGNRTEARNSLTGNIDYAGTDAAAVLQSIIDRLGRTGGLIVLAPGTYIWQSVPAFPRDLPSWLKIVGENGATIRLTSSGPRAFDFKKMADYDTFRNIWIENILIDANSVGGHNHVVLGTDQGGSTQTRVSIEGIVLRNITTTNVLVDPTMENHRLNIYLVVKHPSPQENETSIKSVWIENCDLRGGNQGIVIAGTGPDVTGLNIFIDNIHLRNCRHSLLAPQSLFFYSANFHIGSRGFGGYAHIAECYGEYSADVGVEVNAVDALVENTVIRDVAGAAFYYTNYNNPKGGAEQDIIFRNCIATKIDLPNTRSGMGFAAASHLSVSLGTLTLSNCTFRSSAQPAFVPGEGLRISSSTGMNALTVEGFASAIEKIGYSGAGNSTIKPIYVRITGSTPRITLKNLDLVVNGSRQTGAGALQLTGIDLEGNMLLDLDSVALDFNIANATRYGTRGIDLGRDFANIDGTIRRVKVVQMTDDPDPRGILVRGTATLTITDLLSIEECDFTAMTGGHEVLFVSGNQNRDKVQFFNNQWRTL